LKEIDGPGDAHARPGLPTLKLVPSRRLSRNARLQCQADLVQIVHVVCLEAQVRLAEQSLDVRPVRRRAALCHSADRLADVSDVDKLNALALLVAGDEAEQAEVHFRVGYLRAEGKPRRHEWILCKEPGRAGLLRHRRRHSGGYARLP